MQDDQWFRKYAPVTTTQTKEKKTNFVFELKDSAGSERQRPSWQWLVRQENMGAEM